MKAARWYGRRDVRVEEVPDPKISNPKDVKVRIAWSGICGTDLHEFIDGPIFIPVDSPHPLTGKMAPIIIGHEFGGYVVEVGGEVSNVKIGDLVSVMPMEYCGSCLFCKAGQYNLCPQVSYRGLMDDGGMAEFIVVNENHLKKHSPEMLPELAAFGEPFAVAIHALRKVGDVKGKTVGVVGAGPIGLITAKVAEEWGAKAVFVLEYDNGRRRKAEEIGFTHVFDPYNKSEYNMFFSVLDGLGVDIAVDAGGFSAPFEPVFQSRSRNSLQMAFDITRPGGKVVMIAIHFPEIRLAMSDILQNEKSLFTSWLYVPSDFDEAVKMIQKLEKWIPKLTTKKIYIDKFVEEGLLELELYRSNHIKILVTAHHDFL